MNQWVGLVSVFLLGLASGVSFSHLLQRGPKKTLPPAQFLTVQQVLVIWAGWINPINKTVNTWRPESVPSDWADFRDRWHFLHACRFVLSVIAFSAVIAGLVA
jgi:hypothetical protein